MHHGRISRDLAKALRNLRIRIDEANIRSSAVDETLNLATWNMREVREEETAKTLSTFNR